MSAKSHRRFLEKAAQSEAKKAVHRRGQNSLRKEELARLRIQTLEPWKRVVMGLVGLLLSCAGGYLLYEDAGLAAFILFVLGILILFAAIFGWKKTIQAALDGFDPIQLLDGLF